MLRFVAKKAAAKVKSCPFPGCGVKNPDEPVESGFAFVAKLAGSPGAAGSGVPAGGYSTEVRWQD